MTLLLAEGQCDFVTLKQRLGLTDGNLGAHLRVLENSGFIAIAKSFVSRRPKTTVRLTAAGKKSFLEYLDRLEALIKLANSQGNS